MTLEIDRTSLLVGVPGAATLGSIEAALSKKGLTLGPVGATRAEEAVSDWLAAGAPGARSSFADPADHLVAGLEGTLANGRRIQLRPSPRRAVGPDLIALALGGRERFLSVDYAWLRVHLAGVQDRVVPLPNFDLDPPLSADEALLLDAIARELGR